MERRELAGGKAPLRAGPRGRRHRRLSFADIAAAVPGRRAVHAALPAATAFAAITTISAANGGYFPTDYGWAALGFLALAATAVLLVEHVEVGRPDAVVLACLTALTGWVALSAIWSVSLAQPLLELQRVTLYLATAVALLLLVRGRSITALLGGLAAGITALGAYALATRLVPDAVGVAGSPGPGSVLGEPLGYSNALGLLVVIGALLALGFATEGSRAATSSLGGASLTVLAPVLFFTFSRGAWLALLAGVATAVLVHPNRLRFCASGIIVAIPAAVGVWLSSRTKSLTEEGAPAAEVLDAGHRLAGLVAALVVCSLVLGLTLATLVRCLLRGRRRQLSLVLAAVILAAGVALAVLLAGPPSTSSSYRSAYWRVAGGEYADHPWLGAGAGSFERFWLERRPVNFFSRDAHSLYVETLAELGPVGLLLVLGVVGAPLAALRGVRRRRYAPAAAGAYAAFVLHAGIDWDWEVPAVTLAGLSCGAALLAWGRRGKPRRVSVRFRVAWLAALLPLTAFVFVMHVGNRALVLGSDALAAGRYPTAAAHARTAVRWAPWSPEPWQTLADAQLGLGQPSAARRSLRSALERDRQDWSLWYDLAVVTEGAERRRALREALRLNPLSVEARELRAAS